MIHQGQLAMDTAKEIILDVLVVEDNRINQKIMVAFLTKLGHRYEMAVNGVEAVRLCSVKKFDCILMDIQMAEMDGLEATGLIRMMEEEQNIYTPIIAVTASAPYEDQEEFRRAGLDEYVPKPVSLTVLKNVLTKVIDGAYVT